MKIIMLGLGPLNLSQHLSVKLHQCLNGFILYSPCADCLYVSYYWIKIILYASIPANDHWLMVIWFCICDMLGRLVSPIEYDQ